MPQLVPFYYINQISFSFLALYLLILLSSKHILPMYLKLYLCRIFITKL